MGPAVLIGGVGPPRLQVSADRRLERLRPLIDQVVDVRRWGWMAVLVLVASACGGGGSGGDAPTASASGSVERLVESR